jgi:hypothetical protein
LPLTYQDIDRAKKFVEAAIRRLGVDPAGASAKSTATSWSWAFQRGSAAILVSVTHREKDDGLYVRVVSPLLVMTAETQREALFARLLELNGTGMANCAFGTAGDRVVVVSERPTRGLDVEEAEQMIRHTAAIADEYDDRLVKDFGGMKAIDTKGSA